MAASKLHRLSKYFTDRSRYWTPPKEGSFVVNCAARTGRRIAGISAIVRDCNGDVIAATVERKRYERKIDAQLQSILAACQLIRKLKGEEGIIKSNQTITIETHHKRATQLVNGIYPDEEEDEDDVSDDDDFDGEDEYSVTLIGEAECAAGLPQCVKEMIEKDKVRAGLPVTKNATTKNVGKSAASEKAKDVVQSAASKVASNDLTVKGTSATKYAAGSVALEVANQVPNAEGLTALKEANQAYALESSKVVTKDSTALEKMTKDLPVEDLKIIE